MNKSVGGISGPELSGGFAQRLYQLRIHRGWSQSDVARRIWGEGKPNAKGYAGAKNRDRVSAYELGRDVPTRANLDALAALFEVTLEELAPDLMLARAKSGTAPPATVRFSGEPGGMAHLQVDAVVPLALAAQIAGMLSPHKN